MSTQSTSRQPRIMKLAALLALAAIASASCTTATADLIAYDLPPEPQRYTLAVDSDGAHTAWEYMSSRPSQDDTPQHAPCALAQLEEAPCRAEPLIFLKYDLGLELDNTLPARGRHPVTITGYYQDTDTQLEVTELTLEVTFDEGQTWEEIPTSSQGGGTFTASIRHHPRVAQGGEVVGLRVKATDSQGNTVEQSISHAYRLS